MKLLLSFGSFSIFLWDNLSGLIWLFEELFNESWLDFKNNSFDESADKLALITSPMSNIDNTCIKELLNFAQSYVNMPKNYIPVIEINWPKKNEYFCLKHIQLFYEK